MTTRDGAHAISIDGVTKIYPVPLLRLKRLLRRRVAETTHALADVTFDVAHGEVFGLIGRNGAGKTSLLKMIATLVRPTAGSIRVAGYDAVRDEARVRSLVGLANAEERSFYWRLTATQNMMFFARLHGMSDREARRRIGELYERLDLTQIAPRRFGELSTGNKQRLAVARSLLSRPLVLLLDEPTRSLDPVAARATRELIREFSQNTDAEGRATIVLLTSHNLAEIEELSQRVGIISGGRLRALGTPADLRREHPQQERVRLVARNMDQAATDELRAALPETEIDQSTDGAAQRTIAFTRDAGDDRLDLALRTLHRHGARIMSCDTQQASLLDVLEAHDTATNADRLAPGRGDGES